MDYMEISYISCMFFFFLDVKNKLDDLRKVVKSFQDRAGFTEDLKKMANVNV